MIPATASQNNVGPILYRDAAGRAHYGRIVVEHVGFFQVQTPAGYIAVRPEEVISTL